MTDIRKPFMPPSAVERAADHRRSFTRYATATVLAELQKTSADAILRENWGDDHRAGMILRAPSEPLKQSAFPGDSVVKLMDLAPASAIAEFSTLVTKIDLTGVTSFSLPMAASLAAAKFIAEGAPIPVVKGSFSGTPVGPIRKLALISALSNELETATAGLASIAIGRTLENAIGVGGAQVMFSANAEVVDVAPAGLMHGVAPIAGSADPAKDIKALIGAIAAAGISTKSVVILAASAQALSFSFLNWPKFSYRVIEVPTLAANTVVAVATDAVVMAGEGVPRIETRKQTSLHMSDTPAQIVPAGGPMSAPVESQFQTDTFALRCIARLTWAVAPGAIAWTSTATW
jgi:hypothetical protein